MRISSYLVACCIAVGGFTCPAFAQQVQEEIYPAWSSEPIDTANWMGNALEVFGDSPLKDLAITGSHDSGMSQINGSTLGGNSCNTVTQAGDIQAQLEAGARYFDIRPVIHSGAYYTGHYSGTPIGTQGANGQKMSDIIDQINEFTSTPNRHELVVLNLSHSLNTDANSKDYPSFSQDEWNSLFSELSHLKNLYVSDNSGDTSFPKLSLNKILDGGSKVIVLLEEKNITLGNYKNKGFFPDSDFNVYDSYSGTDQIEKMSADQIKKMDEHSLADYFLLSWTLTQSDTNAALCATSPIKPDSILDMANKANGYLFSKVLPSINSQIFPNIVYTDNVLSSNSAAFAMSVNNIVKNPRSLDFAGMGFPADSYWKRSGCDGDSHCSPAYANQGATYCPDGAFMIGAGLANSGNREVLALQCRLSDGEVETLTQSTGEDNYWRRDGCAAGGNHCSPAYANVGSLVCAEGEVMIGAGFDTVGNRQVVKLVCAPGANPVRNASHEKQGLTPDYWRREGCADGGNHCSPAYANTGVQSCPDGKVMVGAGFAEVGNRQTVQLVCQ